MVDAICTFVKVQPLHYGNGQEVPKHVGKETVEKISFDGIQAAYNVVALTQFLLRAPEQVLETLQPSFLAAVLADPSQVPRPTLDIVKETRGGPDAAKSMKSMVEKVDADHRSILVDQLVNPTAYIGQSGEFSAGLEQYCSEDNYMLLGQKQSVDVPKRGSQAGYENWEATGEQWVPRYPEEQLVDHLRKMKDRSPTLTPAAWTSQLEK